MKIFWILKIFHQGDITFRFLCREACGFESHYPYHSEWSYSI